MPPKPSPLGGEDARLIERVIGLRERSLHAITRPKDGAYTLHFHSQPFGYGRHARSFRIAQRRVRGYEPASPYTTTAAMRSGHRRNAHSFAQWLWWRRNFPEPLSSSLQDDTYPQLIDGLRLALVRLGGVADPTDREQDK